MNVAWYKKRWARIFQHVFIWLILFSLPFMLRQSFNNERKTTTDIAERAFAGLYGFLGSFVDRIVLPECQFPH